MSIGLSTAMSPTDPQSTFSLSWVNDGDIVLIYSRPQSMCGRVARSINVFGQRLLAAIRRVERVSLFARIPSYSHAMIGIGGGLVIHADGKRVSVDVISDVIRPEMKDAARFTVYRHQQLLPQAAAEIVKTAYRYYNQSYGFTPYFGSVKRKPRRREDTTQFCSRLVAHAYRAAGYRLTTLTDARVLPLDLYRICQSKEWRDVTADFIEKAFSEDAERAISDTEIEDIEGMSLQEFLKGSELTMRKGAALQKDLLHTQYESLKNILHTEALGGQFVSAQLDVVKATRIVPDTMDERMAGWVKSALAQLPILLELAELSDIGLLVARSPFTIMTAAEESDDQAAFVGFPAPSVMQQMRMNREAVRVSANLLMAELGMLVIASQLTQDIRFQPFRTIGVRYAEEFFAMVPVIDDLPNRLNSARDGFLWVESESDRDTCRSLCDTIIKVLQMIDVLREANTV